MTKVAHILLTALLAYTAWLQLNDPDPIFWVSLYLLAAVVPLLSILPLTNAASRAITGIAAGFCLAGILMTLPGGLEYLNHMASESLVQDMSPGKPYIEEARELIGTVFAGVVVIAYWVVGAKRAPF